MLVAALVDNKIVQSLDVDVGFAQLHPIVKVAANPILKLDRD